MTDWNLIGKIAGGGFAATITVLVILSAVIWVIGICVQKGPFGRNKKES